MFALQGKRGELSGGTDRKIILASFILHTMIEFQLLEKYSPHSQELVVLIWAQDKVPLGSWNVGAPFTSIVDPNKRGGV
jgi:hypothetical protein